LKGNQNRFHLPEPADFDLTILKHEMDDKRLLTEVAINGLKPQVIRQKVVSVFVGKTLKSLEKPLQGHWVMV